MNQVKKLQGRVAIITGASRLNGIGAAICLALAKEGADIFFTYWTQYDKSMPWGIEDQEPEVLMAEILKLGVKCEKIELDLSNEDAPSRLLDIVEKMLGTPSIVINNATFSSNSDYMNLDAHLLDLHYKLNVRAMSLLSVDFSKRFNLKSGGRIINITSGQSLGPMAGEIAYSATKGAVDAFTVTLSAEVASKGITVNAINPGPTNTGWMNKEIEEYILSKSPFGRIGKPDDAAKLVCFLASDDGEWITGQIIHSEGGFSRG